MDKGEKPTPLGARVYKKHRKIIRKWLKKEKHQSEAAVVRAALEEYDANHTKTVFDINEAAQ